MILSKTTTYAIRILIFMAMNPTLNINSTTLNENLGIPMKYLQRILTDLSKAGFINGSRGRTGGFVFAKSPEEIHLSDVVNAIEDMKGFDTCIMGVTDCQMTNKCILHDSWAESRDLLVKSLTGKTLSDFKNTNTIFE